MRGRRLVPEGLVSIVVLLWGAIGLVAGAAVGALVQLETNSAATTISFPPRALGVRPGLSISRAYESTLNITFTQRHPGLMLLIGVAVGVLVGLVVGLVLSRRPHPSRS